MNEIVFQLMSDYFHKTTFGEALGLSIFISIFFLRAEEEKSYKTDLHFEFLGKVLEVRLCLSSVISSNDRRRGPRILTST